MGRKGTATPHSVNSNHSDIKIDDGEDTVYSHKSESARISDNLFSESTPVCSVRLRSCDDWVSGSGGATEASEPEIFQ